MPRKTATQKGSTVRYYRNKTARLCTQCSQPAAGDHCLCAECQQLANTSTRLRTKTRALQNVCTRCGCVPPETGKTMCRLCLNSLAEQRRARLAKGVCAYCPRDRPPDKTICHVCSAKRREARCARAAKGLCVNAGCSNRAAPHKRCCARCAKRATARLVKLRQRIFDHYGAWCHCPCGCTVTNPNHLTVDHINNDGAEQRRTGEFRGGAANYYRIIRRDFPDDLQILCYNCNCAKAHRGGCT